MLAKRLIDGLSDIPHIVQNGDPHSRYPGCVNLSFAYIEGESLLMALKVMISNYISNYQRMSLFRLAPLVRLRPSNLRTSYGLLAQMTIWHILP